MSVSMSAIWDETLAMLKRERHLLVPLALATVGIGTAAGGLAGPPPGQAGGSLLGLIGSVAANLLSLIGNLALMALVLRPGISVAEAIRLAIARLPKMIAVILTILGALLLLALPFVVLAGEVKLNAQYAIKDLPLAAQVYALMALLVILYIGFRLVTLNALVVDRNPPVFTALRDSFAQTRGLVLKIVGVLLIFLLVSTIVNGAAAAVLGALFGLVGKMLGLPLLGKTIAILIGSLITALFSMVLSVFIGRLHQRISPE